MVRLARDVGNPWLSAMALFSFSMVAERSGDIDAARARLSECAVLFRQMRDRHFINVTQSELGHIERRLGNYAEAVKLYHETIAGWLELGNRSALAHELESLAIIAAAQDRRRRAARLFGAAEALRETIGSSMTALERSEYVKAITRARAQMDESGWSAAWAEGRALPLDQAVAFALEE
ncbi:MAG TPA: tetratricopeptide repeat protein [Herpetosiphonaceae bacterium]|nr:tetratricopeptide repeat protein [Herpetosiphonaceae bacterium]